MGWVNDLEGQVIALDTAPLIYFIEEHPSYLSIVEPFFTAMDEGLLSVVTSTVTLLEVLVYPIGKGNAEVIQKYQSVLLSVEGLTTVDLSSAIAIEAAQLRAKYNIATPDAIQLGTALQMKAAAFLSNDRDLRKVTEIDVLTVDDL
ncbi:MAG: type II toxin-antitoxin system VapC family toxin [Chloroflexota bacterium]